MNMNAKPVELRKIEKKLVCYNGLSPYAMLVKCLETEDEAIIEQAWLCFTEFSVENMIGQVLIKLIGKRPIDFFMIKRGYFNLKDSGNREINYI